MMTITREGGTQAGENYKDGSYGEEIWKKKKENHLGQLRGNMSIKGKWDLGIKDLTKFNQAFLGK